MAIKGRRYIEQTVVEAAKDRFRLLYDTFDSVVLSFSGGKDSVAMLGVAQEVAEEVGRLPVEVLTYDEELVPDSILDVIRHYADQPWVHHTWIAVPMSAQFTMMGDIRQFVQWDPARRWLRPKPEGALTSLPGVPDDMPIDQREITTFTAPLYPGRMAAVIGMRADESRMRGLAFAAKTQENWITPAPATRRVRSAAKARHAHPMYDWATRDVVKYIWERGLRYPTYYDAKAVAMMGHEKELRWSTPLHGSHTGLFYLWRQTEPLFYDQLVDLFPEMLVQERYGVEIDRQRITAEYGTSFSGIRRYIEEKYLDPEAKADALDALRRLAEAARERPDLWPPSHVLTFFVTANYKRGTFPASDRRGTAEAASAVAGEKSTMRKRVEENRRLMIEQREAMRERIASGG